MLDAGGADGGRNSAPLHLWRSTQCRGERGGNITVLLAEASAFTEASTVGQRVGTRSRESFPIRLEKLSRSRFPERTESMPSAWFPGELDKKRSGQRWEAFLSREPCVCRGPEAWACFACSLDWHVSTEAGQGGSSGLQDSKKHRLTKGLPRCSAPGGLYPSRLQSLLAAVLTTVAAALPDLRLAFVPQWFWDQGALWRAVTRAKGRHVLSGEEEY